ncbi:ATP-binding protein [Mycobacterium decipiens]|nr:AAA family ATPase [Mycobacterium decipiens]
MRRYILTGTPGAGKTSILRGLDALGHSVVGEAATDVITHRQAHGEREPWNRASFVDDIVTVQRQRQIAPNLPTTGILVFDRSPVCTHALAVHLGLPVSPALSAELERITTERVYERQVFFIRNLGFCEPTAARRIGFQDALKFEQIHEDSYRAFGYRLIDVPAGHLSRRIAAVHDAISRLAP